MIKTYNIANSREKINCFSSIPAEKITYLFYKFQRTTGHLELKSSFAIKEMAVVVN